VNSTTDRNHSLVMVDLDAADRGCSLAPVNATTDWDHLLVLVDLDATD
jgi:hypothetical protein